MRNTKQLAFSLYQANRLHEARAAYMDICRANTKDSDAWLMLGVVNGQLGLLAESEQCNRHVVSLQPDAYGAWDNLGIVLMMQGKMQEATECFKRALAINPEAAHVLIHLGNLLREQGKPQHAMQHYRAALKILPDCAEAYNNLGNIYQDQCQFSQAQEAYRQALDIKPDYLDACFNMGATLQKSGKHDKAITFYRRSMEIRPDFTEALAAIADIHEKQGQFEEAMELLGPGLKQKPIAPSIALTYAKLCLRTGSPEKGGDILEQLLNQPMQPTSRQELLFALGDIHDELENYEIAFDYYRQANDLRPYAYNNKEHTGYMQSLMGAFDQSSITGMARARPATQRLVFIVGMPRSGTSLVEQILASHTQVFGAGELPYMGDMLSELPSLLGSDKHYPQDISSFSDDDMTALADFYLERLETHSPGKCVVTDKMPHNFLHIGLINRLFPDARIIHCKRNPLDTCLSIYFHNFNANHPYAGNLRHLGEYYRNYEILMKHWHSLFQTRILDVAYEQLVNNQEKISHTLIEFCGLEWEPRCLDFHETDRTVSTPSYDQVRRPMYSSSIGRWKHYASHLHGLKAALDGDH